jgi:hypothetical protein
MLSVLTQTSFPSQVSSGKATRVRQLIAAEAWTDAALALIELELPQWKLRPPRQRRRRLVLHPRQAVAAAGLARRYR